MLLNAGATPLNIMVVGAVTSDFIGLNYAGGIIFYMLADGTGLIDAPSDSPNLVWGNSSGSTGCNNFETLATLSGVGSGVTNTTTILSAACDSTGSAFDYVDTLSIDGHVDWFLPSQDELNLKCEELADSDGIR